MVQADQTAQLVPVLLRGSQDRFDSTGGLIPLRLVDGHLRQIRLRRQREIIAADGASQRECLLENRRARGDPAGMEELRGEVQQQIGALGGIVAADGQSLFESRDRAGKVAAVRKAQSLVSQQTRRQPLVVRHRPAPSLVDLGLFSPAPCPPVDVRPNQVCFEPVGQRARGALPLGLVQQCQGLPLFSLASPSKRFQSQGSNLVSRRSVGKVGPPSRGFAGRLPRVSVAGENLRGTQTRCGLFFRRRALGLGHTEQPRTSLRETAPGHFPLGFEQPEPGRTPTLSRGSQACGKREPTVGRIRAGFALPELRLREGLFEVSGVNQELHFLADVRFALRPSSGKEPVADRRREGFPAARRRNQPSPRRVPRDLSPGTQPLETR
jgi:hypothetical protein